MEIDQLFSEGEQMSFIQVSDKERQQFGELSSLGYVFNWKSKSSSNTLLTAVISNGDIAGLIEYERRPAELYNYIWLVEVASLYKGSTVAGKLLAYVGRDSISQGFDGFVLFEPKTKLYNYFIERYGAKPSAGKMLYFDTVTTQHLISMYL